jgi:hypothetical protein
LMSVAEFGDMSADEMVIHLFAETADNVMSKLALEILANIRPTVSDLRVKVTETENAIWYKQNTGIGKTAQVGRYCESCKTKSHNTSECWGACTICGRKGHQVEYCRDNPNAKSVAPTGMANTATVVTGVKKKKEKKKKKKKLGKTAVEPQEGDKATDPETFEEETEETASEEDSPVKQAINNRAARVGMPPDMARRALFKNLNSELSNMSAEATKEWGQGIFKALKAKSAKNDDSPVVLGKI